MPGFLPAEATARPARAARADGIDVLKGVACTLIVWHHLAAYGPMSDVVHLTFPRVTGWLYDNARLAVQVFLVVGGFLSAAALPRHQARIAQQCRPIFQQLLQPVLQRFSRLAPAYWVALAVSMAVSAGVRPWFDHPSVPDAPTWPQVAAHVLLLHDVLGQPALSAGIWYVAIDLQLYALAALVTLAGGWAKRSGASTTTARRVAMAATWVLAALSLLVFNRQPGLDTTALYFFGAYGLGMLAFWATQLTASRERLLWVGLLTLTALLALWLDFRSRIALALGVAWVLVWWQWSAAVASTSTSRSSAMHVSAFGRVVWAPLTWLGKRSYSIFLIHFPVCLLFNAVLAQAFPTQLGANVLGMLTAFAMSVLAGTWLHRHVEVRVRRQPVVRQIATG